MRSRTTARGPKAKRCTTSSGIGVAEATRRDSGRHGGAADVNHQDVGCAYDGTGFVPSRRRPEKGRPNSAQTAESVWNDINDPIAEATIRGKTLKVFRKMANGVKRELLERWVPSGSVLLDIGSGRGGDLSKWQRLKHVLAVEPDSVNRKEFVRRRDELTGRMKLPEISLIPLKFQDSDGLLNTLKNTRIQAVSAFFCLTYLTSDEATWKAFLVSLDLVVPVGAHFVGCVLDGTRTRSLLLAGPFENEVVSMKSAENVLTALGEERLGEEITITLSDPDAIVKQQTEFLFYYERFRHDLGALGFVEKETSFFDTRQGHSSLPVPSQAYSRLIRLFVFLREKKPELPVVAPVIDDVPPALSPVISSFPYKCSDCAREYRRKGDLTKHRAILHSPNLTPPKTRSNVKVLACSHRSKCYSR